jgi:hypothetical protein
MAPVAEERRVPANDRFIDIRVHADPIAELIDFRAARCSSSQPAFRPDSAARQWRS